MARKCKYEITTVDNAWRVLKSGKIIFTSKLRDSCVTFLSDRVGYEIDASGYVSIYA